MRFAIIEDGIVNNIALADAPMGDDWIEATDAAQIGGTWDGVSFGPAPVTNPAEALAAERAGMVCSPAQIRLTLLQLGLLDTVQAIADSDPIAAIVWEYAAEIRRTNALIDALAGDGFTPTQIDDIFRYAMALVI